MKPRNRDTDDFPGLLTGLGQEAAAAICHQVESMQGSARKPIAQNRNLALDSVDAYLQETVVLRGRKFVVTRAQDVAAKRRMLDEHPLMQAELRRQASETERISALRGLDEETLVRFKAEAKGQSLFDVSVLMMPG